MKFLIDTNILIPLEPTSPSNAEATTEQAIRLVRLVAENGHQIYLHPASLTDLSGTRIPTDGISVRNCCRSTLNFRIHRMSLTKWRLLLASHWLEATNMWTTFC